MITKLATRDQGFIGRPLPLFPNHAHGELGGILQHDLLAHIGQIEYADGEFELTNFINNLLSNE